MDVHAFSRHAILFACFHILKADDFLKLKLFHSRCPPTFSLPSSKGLSVVPYCLHSVFLPTLTPKSGFHTRGTILSESPEQKYLAGLSPLTLSKKAGLTDFHTLCFYPQESDGLPPALERSPMRFCLNITRKSVEN